MKINYTILVGLVIIGGQIYSLTTNAQTMKPQEAKDNPYLDLRKQIFEATPEQIGLSPSDEEEPYAIVMDLSIRENATATLVSVVDGNASLYLSSGGGIIGGYAHERVRKAAIDFVSMGKDYFSRMKTVDSFPLPQTGNVRFYILTNKGKYFVEEQIDKIENGKSDWAELFFEGNKVLGELRLISGWK